ncbi:MAG: hypothetical protein H7301_09435 [Cryobacterium sp.]|nr:hypothetical protein [Oligoflexia bacterium]
MISVLTLVPLFLLSSGCSTAPKPGEYTARELLAAACPTDFGSASKPRTVQGTVWTKIESKEISGQFPASVRAEYPTRLGVEVTNLIGSPQAWLKIENGKTELKFTAENDKEFGAPRIEQTLGGMPIEFALRLFAGGVPCPEQTKDRDVRVKTSSEGDLEVEERVIRTNEVTTIHYSFTRYAGSPWVKEVRWEKLASNVGRSAKSKLIRMTREEPDSADGAPLKWSVVSEAGEIRVRWKNRGVSGLATKAGR